MTQSTDPTENHNETSQWLFELQILGIELDDHVHRMGLELDEFRSEIDRTESKLKELQREVMHREYKLPWVKKCWYTAHKLGLIMERHGELILNDDPHLFDDFPDSWDLPEGKEGKERK